MNAQAAFDIVSLELTIFATLLGFISVLFIFWYGQVKEKFKDIKPNTMYKNLLRILYKSAFYLFDSFIIFGIIGILSGIWILNLIAVMPGPLSSLYLKSDVDNALLLFSQWFSFWIIFSLLFIVLVL
jgi:hypothetical protein